MMMSKKSHSWKSKEIEIAELVFESSKPHRIPTKVVTSSLGLTCQHLCRDSLDNQLAFNVIVKTMKHIFKTHFQTLYSQLGISNDQIKSKKTM